MKILVCIKAVPEPQQIIRSESGAPVVHVDDTTELAMNRYDAFAVEEAILLKEKFPGTIVDALSMGPTNALKSIKRAMGMGADTGIHIRSNYSDACDAASSASCIAAAVTAKDYDLIFCGIMSEDMMQFSTGPMIAQRLGYVWATSVIRTEMSMESRKIRIERELEGGIREIAELRLPALLSIQSGINEPRYPALSRLLKANAHRIRTISSKSLAIAETACRTTGYAYPEKKRAGRILQGSAREKADALIQILHEKSII